MGKISNPPVAMTGLHITGATNGPAITLVDNTMTVNSGASIRMGGITLTEDTFARMEIALEFIERFTAENEEARAVWTAIKAKRRILK
jgi:hypothetical protein